MLHIQNWADKLRDVKILFNLYFLKYKTNELNFNTKFQISSQYFEAGGQKIIKKCFPHRYLELIFLTES